ncbi:PAS/PAC sensor signal transduction histidine kinase [Haloferax elongans ATCC BAA-1513]|uniref:histidine kinase n=1 Tax=Haloferax elongans ATCC BAA-1513 TaxID=1230453 RepID=M0HRX9_HALEO|nr:HAMP domain-containing sensor histidine kinase [Haloferax elongans]ELZ85874.1 PAS/PAC sensor signal transduction histidine kinase [Haloferax elongans ATCC BAA-1513]
MDTPRERQIHFDQAQEIADIGSWHLDLREDTFHWSKNCYRIFGVPQNVSMTFERFLSRVHPDDRSEVEAAWNAALNGDPYDIEHRIVVDGETRWVRERGELEYDSTGEPVRAIGVVMDITTRKAREREIQLRKRRYQSLFNSIQDTILVADADRTIIDGNPAFTDLFGYELDDVIGESVRLIYANEAEFREVGQRLKNSSDKHTTITMQCQKRSGQVFPAETTIVRRNDASGKTLGFVGVIRDVSEREDRRQQMKVIDRVLRHNLRNDLNLVQGSAEMILESSAKCPDRTAQTILDTSRRLLDTAQKWRRITTFLADPPADDVIDVGSVVDSVVSRVRQRHPDATVAADRPDDCRADATQAIGEAIEELLENAVVHSGETPANVALLVSHRDAVVEIRVVDDGPRIPEMERKVLTREEEIEPLYHGSGLGLWLVNLIVRQSGGMLEFDENEPHGNIVTILLPTA